MSEIIKQLPEGIILGSFSFKRVIDKVIDDFEQEGVVIVAPRKGMPSKKVSGFGLVEGDISDNPIEVELDFISKIRTPRFAYIVNPRGYVGITVAAEMGVAMIRGLPIYCLSALDELLDADPYSTWASMAKIVKSYPVREVAQMAKTGNYNVDGYFWCHS